MKFAERLQAIRKENNISQEKLGKLLNISKSNISKYESETVKPSLELAFSISKIFNVSIDYLTGSTNIKNPISVEADEFIKKYMQSTPEEREIIKAQKDLSPAKEKWLKESEEFTEDTEHKVLEYIKFLRQQQENDIKFRYELECL